MQAKIHYLAYETCPRRIEIFSYNILKIREEVDIWVF